MKLNVTKIEIAFSKGSFAEWANMFEEQNEEDIARWQLAYYKQVEKKIKELYPYAQVEAAEGYEQLWSTKYYVDTNETQNSICDYEFSDVTDEYAHFFVQEETKQTIDDILSQVANAGAFWD